MEIMLLCGNGYGIGGMKLLRGMYERVVTLGYIAKNPEKTGEFLEYYPIYADKHFNHANQICRMDKHFAPEEIDAIQELYEGAKDKYQEVTCETCGTTRTRCSWPELDVASMARVAGLEKLYLRCYYEPTLQSQATVSSLITRMKMRNDGQISFDEDAQRENVDGVLNAAHNINTIRRVEWGCRIQRKCESLSGMVSNVGTAVLMLHLILILGITQSKCGSCQP